MKSEVCSLTFQFKMAAKKTEANSSLAGVNGGLARLNKSLAEANNCLAGANVSLMGANGSFAGTNVGLTGANNSLAGSNDGLAEAFVSKDILGHFKSFLLSDEHI